MKLAQLVTVAVFVPALMLMGCSKAPTPVGINLFPNNEKFAAHDTTLGAIGDTTIHVSSVNGGGGSVLVGNQSSVDCKGLLRFYVTIPESLTSVQIDSAELSLTVSYSWDASVPATPSAFDVKEVTTPWSAVSVTVDSLNGLGLVQTNSSPFVLTSQDTLVPGKILTAQIDTSLIRRWITISADTADTLTPRFFSLAIVTDPAYSNVGVWGFSEFGSSTPPNLVIIYEKDGIKDSVYINVGESTFLATGPSLSSSSDLQVQGGISVRSKVFFDKSALMKAISDSIVSTKAIINNATMMLTLDPASSLLGAGSEDSLVAYLAGSPVSPEYPDSIQAGDFAYGYRQDTSQTNNVYVFNVTTMAQQWINSPSNNFGVSLRALNDNGSVDKLSFFSVKDSTKAPKISITFTKR
ncbi:MAG TPA: DNRLRE domain-containing protein [Bacteroidota bacterium]|nr:DNRLRE domain-containing protein [Bacteroidota bacterium]